MMPDMGTTRRFQFSLGMLLAFIAGMAVMLAVLLLYWFAVKWNARPWR